MPWYITYTVRDTINNTRDLGMENMIIVLDATRAANIVGCNPLR